MAFVVAISAATSGFAQDHEVGAKLGYNHLFMKYDNILGTSSSSLTQELGGGGFVFGGYYSYTPMDNLFLQAELLFSNRMWNEITIDSYEGQVSTISEKYTHYTNNYLEIPLIVKYGINLRKTRYGGNKYLFFYGGTSTHILMTTKGSQQETFRVDAQGQSTVSQNETIFDKSDLKNHFTPVQASVLGGISFNFEFGLNVDLRYQYLMMPVTRPTPQATDFSEGFGVLKQGMATFTIGYNFLTNY